jgi:hypothetical protein
MMNFYEVLLNLFLKKQDQNLANGHDMNDPRLSSTLPYYCLMGAEDHWRWNNPCRCDDCKKLGVTRIDH